jgi:cytochrome c-type biogenesis protein CcsB
MNTKIFLTLMFFSFVHPFVFAKVSREGFEFGRFETLAIQERGRLKPFHTFAVESLRFVTGARRFEGLDPIETVLSWHVEFDSRWRHASFIFIDHKPLKEYLGLDVGRRRFSPQELGSNARLRELVANSQQRQSAGERLDDIQARGLRVQQQLRWVELVVSGDALAILPNPDGLELSWFPLSVLNGPGSASPAYSADATARAAALFTKIFDAFKNGRASEWNALISSVVTFLRDDLSRGHYPSMLKLRLERHYNIFRPFRVTWVLYLMALGFLLLGITGKTSRFLKYGLTSLGLGLLVHSYGFFLRCYLSGRPPVTNMYESVVWVSWGAVVFSLIIWAFYKNAVILSSATVFSVIALILSDSLPGVLDAGIHPLEPVLRSNFWLTTHVLTITLSYSAFALSLCLGNVVLAALLARAPNPARIQSLTLYMYRAVQIGVILVAAGTILGGVWADYSWGRFWGWDPKEVWALIVLLLYIAVLHGRFAGWLKGFRFVAASVLCFMSVLMAWYGVNFVLGVGLHSYGFGSGGFAYMLAYVVLQVVFIIFVYARARHARSLGL